MTKQDSERKKNYINVKKIDPLSERMSKTGMKGGASKSLSKGAKTYIKDATKANLRFSKEVTKTGKRGDFGSPMASKAAAKELKTGSKESTLKSGLLTPGLYKKLGEKPLNEARKYLKKKKVEYRKQKDYLRKISK